MWFLVEKASSGVAGSGVRRTQREGSERVSRGRECCFPQISEVWTD